MRTLIFNYKSKIQPGISQGSSLVWALQSSHINKIIFLLNILCFVLIVDFNWHNLTIVRKYWFNPPLNMSKASTPYIFFTLQYFYWHARRNRHNAMLLFVIWLFMMEVNLTCFRVPSPWNVLISNVLVFVFL